MNIDITTGKSFEQYIDGGVEEQIAKMRERSKTLDISAELKDVALSVKRPIIIAAFAATFCPDCTAAVPVLEAIKALNSKIDVLYFERSDETRPLLREISGSERIPTIVKVDSEGRPTSSCFVERPPKVCKMVDDAPDDDAEDAVIADYRAGRYDAELFAEIAKIIRA